MKHKFYNQLFLSLRILIGGLPEFLLPMASMFFSFLATFNKKRTLRAMNNIEASFLSELGQEKCQQILNQHFKTIGQTLSEYLFYSCCDISKIVPRVELHGWEHVEQARQNGKGVILLAGHYGNWEIQNIIMAYNGFPLYHAYSGKQSNPYFGASMNALRKKYSIQPIPDSETTARKMVDLLKNNQILSFVADQIPLNSITAAPFFGENVAVSDGMLSLAVKLDCPVLFSWIKRRSRLQYQMFIIPLVYEHSGHLRTDMSALAGSFMAQLENIIRQEPGQYLWDYRRGSRKENFSRH